jgi:SAM-dependent methyltransferase
VNSRPTAEIYTRPDVVAVYDGQHELHGAEALLFDDCVKTDAKVLDLGVGGGRTTPYLARLASRYVGVDVSEVMLARYREKFPEMTLLRLDATDLGAFPNESFDAVVFSFNGIDTIPTLEGRRRCFAECSRVLRPGGTLLFSVHNARYLIFSPVLGGTGPVRAAWRLLYAAGRTIAHFANRFPTVAFRCGAGFSFDPLTHGGLMTFVATPQHVAPELIDAGLILARYLPGQFPGNGCTLRTPWY